MERSVDYFLTSQRLGFRTWREEDLDLAMGLWGDPEVTRLIDARGKLSERQVLKLLLEQIAIERRHGVQYWPIFLLEDAEHVGCCGLRPRAEDEADDEEGAYEERPILELGFHIRRRHWRRGYAAEAARATIGYAFNILGAKALFAGHHPENEPSRALLLKLGFTPTGAERYEPTGLMHPSYRLTRGRGPGAGGGPVA